MSCSKIQYILSCIAKTGSDFFFSGQLFVCINSLVPENEDVRIMQYTFKDAFRHSVCVEGIEGFLYKSVFGVFERMC